MSSLRAVTAHNRNRNKNNFSQKQLSQRGPKRIASQSPFIANSPGVEQNNEHGNVHKIKDFLSRAKN